VSSLYYDDDDEFDAPTVNAFRAGFSLSRALFSKNWGPSLNIRIPPD